MNKKSLEKKLQQELKNKMWALENLFFQSFKFYSSKR